MQNNPGQYAVSAIIRDDKFVVPRGKTTILKGDHIVVQNNTLNDSFPVLLRSENNST